ncbi:uncharacterized protein Tco025E_04867, partial [Trypanosoma conorhini]
EVAAELEAGRVAGELAALEEEESACRRALEVEAVRAADGIARARGRSARDAAVRERQRQLAAQAESAAATRAQLRRESRRIEEEEAGRRGAIEQDEDEERADLLDAMDRDAEVAAELEAGRVVCTPSSSKTTLVCVSTWVSGVASSREEEASQTPQEVLPVKATGTEGEMCIEGEPMVRVESLVLSDGPQLAGDLRQQLGHVGRSSPTGGLRAFAAAEGKFVEAAEEAAGEVGGGTVVAGGVAFPCCSQSVQTALPRSVAVQVWDAHLESRRPCRASSRSRASGLWQGGVLSPREPGSGPSKSSKCTGPSPSSRASVVSREVEGDKVRVAVSVEELPSLELDSPCSHASERQWSPSFSVTSLTLAVAPPAAQRPGEMGSLQPVDASCKRAPHPPKQLARIRHGGRAGSSLETPPRLQRDSLTSDEERRTLCPHWGLDNFEFDWSSGPSPCSTGFRRLVHVETRHRQHVERHELLARNEVRWEELNHYRAWARWHEANKDASEEEEGEETEIDGEEAADAHGRVWGVAAAAAEDGNDEKENIAPRTEVPQPAGAVQRSRSAAWCVDMTGGSSGTPPHLRDRPWAAMLTRRNSQSGGKGASAVGRLPPSTPQACRRTPTDSFGTAGTLVRRAAAGDTRSSSLQRAPETVSGRRYAEFPGYAQRYEQRLLWQQLQQEASGPPAPEPIYRRATASFLESAEWCYQKMYVDRLLCAGRRDGSVRRCADVVCEEVGRAQLTWELQRS